MFHSGEFLTDGVGFPVVGGLLALTIAGTRLPFSVSKILKAKANLWLKIARRQWTRRSTSLARPPEMTSKRRRIRLIRHFRYRYLISDMR